MATNGYPYAKQPVDLRKRKEMQDFLTNHFRYNTMKSWNESTSYANCIKLPMLDLPAEFNDEAVQGLILGIVRGEILCDEWDNHVIKHRQDFLDRTGYYIGFNGKSSGYLVLYNTKNDPASGTRVMVPGMPLDQDAEFDKWEMDKLRDRVKLIQDFDRTCDGLRDAFVDVIKNGTLMERKLKRKQVQRVFAAGTRSEAQADDPSLTFVYDPRTALEKGADDGSE